MTMGKEQNEEMKFIDAVKDMTDDERNAEIEANFNSYLTFLPNGDYKIPLLKRVWGRYIESSKIDTEVEIVFYRNEVEFLQQLPTDEIKRIFYSLMCKQKIRPHKSGWIRLDFSDTMKFGFGEKKAAKLKIDILAQCREYGFDAQVVGSNEPVVCFKIPIEGDIMSGVAYTTTNLRASMDYKRIVEVAV